MAENSTNTMHNILTLRGAQVRDALKWSSYLNETIEMWGDEVEVKFQSHHWPMWGSKEIVAYFKGQRDMYKYKQWPDAVAAESYIYLVDSQLWSKRQMDGLTIHVPPPENAQQVMLLSEAALGALINSELSYEQAHELQIVQAVTQ